MAEEAQRHGAPDRECAAEGSRTQEGPQPTADAYAELSSIRDPDDPPLPAPMNRKRTTEKRDQVRSIRFTPTALRLIDDAAAACGKKLAGYVGDAALKEALGHRTAASPEDDPLRPLVEAIEAQTAQLRHIGNNLNQIARATSAGATPDHADTVLTRLRHVLDASHATLDTLLEE